MHIALSWIGIHIDDFLGHRRGFVHMQGFQSLAEIGNAVTIAAIGIVGAVGTSADGIANQE